MDKKSPVAISKPLPKGSTHEQTINYISQMRDQINAAHQSLTKRLDELESRIKTLEG